MAKFDNYEFNWGPITLDDDQWDDFVENMTKPQEVPQSMMDAAQLIEELHRRKDNNEIPRSNPA